MILVGELEYTNKMMAPDGCAGWLYVGCNGGNYYYNISPYDLRSPFNPADNTAWLGTNTVTETPISVTEFLQTVVNMDDDHGGGLRIRYDDNVGIRLKGMTEWIRRQPLKQKESNGKV